MKSNQRGVRSERVRSSVRTGNEALPRVASPHYLVLSFPRLRGDVSRCRDCVVCVAVSQDGRDTTHHMVSTKCASCASQTWCRVS